MLKWMDEEATQYCLSDETAAQMTLSEWQWLVLHLEQNTEMSFIVKFIIITGGVFNCF